MIGFNPVKYRKDFKVLGKYTYLDSSCVSLKPKQVLEAMNSYYEEYSACGGRSSHALGRKVTAKIEEARKTISKHFNAKTEEIIFTRNTTEGINLVAKSFPFKEGDRILLSDKEHNSNLVPWQVLEKKKKIKLEFYEHGNIEDFKRKVKGTTLVATNHTSNLDGTTQDVKEMARIAREEGAKILVDGAQSASHKEINLKNLGVDFYTASGHKMLGPSGTGFLYGKKEELEKLDLFITGGETVKDTTYEGHEVEELPHRYEAGLQDYAGIIGFSEAVKYLQRIGMKNIEKHELKLNKKITEAIKDIPGLTILGGKPEERSGIISFTVEGMDPHDIALQLDNHNVLVRSGYHCCHSWFNSKKINGSVRASLYLYNDEEDADKFIESLKKAMELLR